MTKPLKAVGTFFNNAIEPIMSVTKRAITPPGMGGNDAAAPAPPSLAPEASSPNAKPKKKGQQSSFLSGVAASALGGQSGSSGGKSLLGQ